MEAEVRLELDAQWIGVAIVGSAAPFAVRDKPRVVHPPHPRVRINIVAWPSRNSVPPVGIESVSSERARLSLAELDVEWPGVTAGLRQMQDHRRPAIIVDLDARPGVAGG